MTCVTEFPNHLRYVMTLNSPCAFLVVLALTIDMSSVLGVVTTVGGGVVMTVVGGATVGNAPIDSDEVNFTSLMSIQREPNSKTI